MRSDYPRHLNATEYLGLRRYFLTFCTDFRRTFFVDRDAVELVRSQIVRAAIQHHVAIVAYCFMPDHLHLLVEGMSDDSDGLAFIRSAKQYSGFYFSKARRQRLWQPYGYEHILRDDEAALDIARYIFANPVRAGLVADPREYPFLGSQVYAVEEVLEGVADTRAG